MTTTTINLNDRGPIHGTPTFRVYTKFQWSDPFVVQQDVLVEEVVWAVAPSISTATLHYRYGSVIDPGSSTLLQRPPADSRGWFVLIVITGDGQDAPMHWLGFAESAVTTQRFADDSGGVQVIPCYGMDRALQLVRIESTVFANPDPNADPDDQWRRRGVATPFNPTNPGNRTENRVTIVSQSGSPDIESYLFANPSDDDTEFWSTRDIFEYLATVHLPTSDFQLGRLPWQLAGDLSVLPNWDRPVVGNVEQMSVHQLITELLGADRMLGWSVQPVVTATNNFLATTPFVQQVQIIPFSRLSTALPLPSVGNMPANDQQIVWVSDADAATDSQVQQDDSDRVDQVIVRGPREVGVGTFRFDSDGGMRPAWDQQLQSNYEVAFSGDPGWANLKQYEKAEWNDYYRSQTRFHEVHRLWRMDPNWDGLLEGEPLLVEQPDGDGGMETYVPYLGNCRFLDDLPLFAGVDYEGAADQVNETDGRYRLPILAFIERPNQPLVFTRLQSVHNVFGAPPVRNPNKLDFDVSVAANNSRGPGVDLNISGAPQHALSKNQFTPNDGDPELLNPNVWGGYDVETMLMTVAMEGDRRPEYRIPDSVPGDLVRRRVITLEHPGLQLVHIATDTVVGLDRNGNTLQSDGGVLRDTQPLIEAMCRIAAESLVNPRKSVSIRTGRMVTGIRVGQLIKSVDGNNVNSIVREIRIASPVVESDSPPPTIMSISASNNEIDLVALVGRVPEPEVSAP